MDWSLNCRTYQLPGGKTLVLLHRSRFLVYYLMACGLDEEVHWSLHCRSYQVPGDQISALLRLQLSLVPCSLVAKQWSKSKRILLEEGPPPGPPAPRRSLI